MASAYWSTKPVQPLQSLLLLYGMESPMATRRSGAGPVEVGDATVVGDVDSVDADLGVVASVVTATDEVRGRALVALWGWLPLGLLPQAAAISATAAAAAMVPLVVTVRGSM
jgi:hypothetical protein